MTGGNDFDFSLFGDVLIKPSTGEEADPVEVLSDKIVSFVLFFLSFLTDHESLCTETSRNRTTNISLG